MKQAYELATRQRVAHRAQHARRRGGSNGIRTGIQAPQRLKARKLCRGCVRTHAQRKRREPNAYASRIGNALRDGLKAAFVQ